MAETGDDDEDDGEEGAAEEAASKHLLTGLAITPGTTLMVDISTSIASWWVN